MIPERGPQTVMKQNHQEHMWRQAWSDYEATGKLLDATGISDPYFCSDLVYFCSGLVYFCSGLVYWSGQFLLWSGLLLL